jgi:hypothetical protein
MKRRIGMDTILKPFHESVVDAIERASDSSQMNVIGQLLIETKIPKGWDDIVKAWNTKIHELDYYDELEVAQHVLAQKSVV